MPFFFFLCNEHRPISLYNIIADIGCKEAISAEYRELLLGFGEQREYVDAVGAFTAVIEGVEPTGHLLFRRCDGTLSRYAFKEVEQPMSD